MAYYTERQKMEMRLLQCIVERPGSASKHQARTLSSSDVTASSSSESDGDAPVIPVPHSSSSSPTSPVGQPRAADQPRQRQRPSSSVTTSQTLPPTSQTKRPLSAYQQRDTAGVRRQNINPNPNRTRNEQRVHERNSNKSYDRPETRWLANSDSKPRVGQDGNSKLDRNKLRFRERKQPDCNSNHKSEIGSQDPNDSKPRVGQDANPNPDRDRRSTRIRQHRADNANPNPNRLPRQRTPSFDLVVDSDVERSRHRAWPQNHTSQRPATTSNTSHVGLRAQTAGRYPEFTDDRLAKKYFELRQMILDKLDMRTLTPQVRRQARQLVQKYYRQGSASSAAPPPGWQYQRAMTLGNPPRESEMSQVQTRGPRVQDRTVTVRCGVGQNDAGRSSAAPVKVRTAGQDKRLNSTAGGDMERKKVTFVDDYTQQESSDGFNRTAPAVLQSEQAERSNDEMTSEPHHRLHQQQQDTESHSDDSYSSEFSSDGSGTSSDERESPSGETQKPNSPVDAAARQIDADKQRSQQRPSTASKTSYVKERDDTSHESTKNQVTASSYDKRYRTSSPSSRKPGTSPTRSRTSREFRRATAASVRSRTGSPSSKVSGRVSSSQSGELGRTGTSPTRSRTNQRQGDSRPNSGKNRSPSRKDSFKHHKAKKTGQDDDDIGSSTSASSESLSRSPARRVHSRSPTRSNPAADYHLKYTDKDEIRHWLRSKNSMRRRQKRDRRRSERARRHELQEKELAMEERHRESEMLVKRWMEEKRMENRILDKRQQQQRATESLAHPRTDSKPSEDKSRKSSASRKTAAETKVPLFSRLDKYDTFPGASTWKSPNREISHAERRKMYGDWLRSNRTAGTEQHESGTEVGEQKNSTLETGTQRLEQQDRRGTSARGGRRRRAHPEVPRLDGVRPSSATRLEPQGADHLDPSPELVDNTAELNRKQSDEEKSTSSAELKEEEPDSTTFGTKREASEDRDDENWTSSTELEDVEDQTTSSTKRKETDHTDEEKSTSDAELKDPERTFIKESASYIVPHVNVEFEDGNVSQLGVADSNKPRTSNKNAAAATKKSDEDQTHLGPRMHSGRDLMTLIQSESRFLLVDSDSSSRCSSYNRQLTQETLESGGEDKEQPQPHQEKEKEDDRSNHIGLTLGLETVKTSSFLSVACDTDISMGRTDEEDRSERHSSDYGEPPEKVDDDAGGAGKTAAAAADTDSEAVGGSSTCSTADDDDDDVGVLLPM